MDSIKQVIVCRDKFPDGKGGTKSIRKGKMIAQACHASMKFLVDRLNITGPIFSKEESQWLNGSFTKVCVKCDSEEQLLDIQQKAESAGLIVCLITDGGKTEFHGIPTNTCLAIGPDLSSKIDPITGELTLL